MYRMDRVGAAKYTDGLQMAPGSSFQAACSVSGKNSFLEHDILDVLGAPICPKKQDTTK